MRTFLFVLLFATPAFTQTLPPEFEFDTDCQWIMGQDSFGTAEDNQILDTPCLDVLDSSVVWLDSTGCQCFVDIRIMAAPQSCEDDCDAAPFSYYITGVSSSAGNVVGDWLSGTANADYPQPPLLYLDSVVIPCGDTFVFNFSSSCSCLAENNDLSDVFIDASGVGVYNARFTTYDLLCSYAGSHCTFASYCVEDCVPGNEPDPIPIEAASD